ncbi:phage tail length tape measure family protein [Methylobacterium sp. 22177]|uniref:phage tail length tape measure family protein n=1 Tax=Methylobacterium sp. 22177 TaxID=3453885 RepID=UPI003F8267D1
MPSIETIRRVTVQYSSQGADKVRADAEAVAAAQTRMGAAAEAASVTTEAASRRTLSVAGAYDRLLAKIDPTVRQQQLLERSTRTVDRAFEQAAISATEHARTLDLLQVRYGGVAAAAQRSARDIQAAWRGLGDQGAKVLENIEASRRLGALGGTGTAAAANENRRLRADQVQNLAYQASDIVSSLGSGSNLSTVAFQQGPQIAQVFGGPGGASLRGAFTQAGDAAAGLAARVGLVGGAVGVATAAIGTGIVALGAYRDQQKELSLSLAGMGRASGTTVGQINAIAAAAAGPAGLSVSAAREMAGEFASTGRIGSEMYGKLLGAARDYAVITRQELPDAAKALAEAFAAPAAGAETLNKQLGFLDAEAQENIQRLDAQGNRLGAQRALFEAFAGSVEKADARLGFFSRQWQEFSRNTSNEFDAIGAFIDRGLGGGAAEERLKALQGQLDFRQRNKGTAGGLFDSLLGFDENQIRADIAKVQAEIDQAAQRSRTTDLAQRSREVNRLVQGANPEGEALKKAQDAATKIRTDLAAGVIDPNGESRRTMEGFEASARRIAEDLRNGGSALADGLRRAQFDASQVGRSGLGRTSAEIEFEFADRQRKLEAQNLEPSKRFEQMQAMELERVTRLQTAQREASFSETGRSGLINRVPANLRQHYLDAASQTGVPLDLLLGVSYAESRFNPTAAANRNFPTSHAYGLMQLQPGTARELGVDPTDPRQNVLGGARYLRARLDQANGDEALAYGLYHDGPASSGTSAAARKAFAEVQRFRNMPTTGQEIAGDDARSRALENENRLVQLNSQYLGRNGEALDAATRQQQLLNDAISQGREITPQLRDEFAKTAAAMASATRTLAGTRAGRDLEFERDQLGRDRYDQGAFSRARSTFGDTTSPQAQAFIGEARQNAMLSDARTTLTDAATSFATSLSHGENAAKAFGSALSRIGDKILGGAIDSLIGSAFKSGGGLGSLLGFADGGFTGHGAKYEPAGIVHRGEYVIDAATVGRVGRGFFDGLRGYADGGFVSMPATSGPVPPVPTAPAEGQGTPGQIAISIDARGAQGNAEVQAAIDRGVATGMSRVQGHIERNINAIAANGARRYRKAG